MTLAAVAPLIEYLENGVSVTFAVPFQFVDSADLEVTRISAAGVETLAVLGADYSVTGGAGATGSVTMAVALAAGWTLRNRRVTERTQPANYTPGDNFPAETLEGGLDRVTAMIQEVEAGADAIASRAVLVPEGDTGPVLGPLADFVGMAIGVDVDHELVPLALSDDGAGIDVLATLALGTGLGLIGMAVAGVDIPTVSALAVLRSIATHVHLWRLEDDDDDTLAVGRAIANAPKKPILFVEGEGSGTAGDAGKFILDRTIFTADLIMLNLGRPTCRFVDGSEGSSPVPGSRYAMFQCTSSSNTARIRLQVHGIKFEDRLVAATRPFMEGRAFFDLAGVEAYFDDCDFNGFRGDAITFSGETTGALVADTNFRRNGPCDVRRCRFDGIDNENRNAISIIDGTGITIAFCRFANCTRPDMPGAVDIEPNGFDHYKVSNITVAFNAFTGIGGNVGLISVFVPAAVDALPTGFLFIGNRMITNSASGADFFLAFLRVFSATDQGVAAVISHHVGEGGAAPFKLFGIKGVEISGQWYNYSGTALLGFDGATDSVRDIVISGRMTLCGTTASTFGLLISKCSGVYLRNLVLDRCGGGGSGTAAILLHGAVTSDRIVCDNLEVIGVAGQTYAIYLGGSHVQTPANNRLYPNCRLNGLLSTLVVANPRGDAVLVAGTVTVAAPGIAAASRIKLTRRVVGGTQGHLSVGTVTAGTSFVINSSDAADTSTIYYEAEAA